jgi:uncharacterized membrane protein
VEPVFNDWRFVALTRLPAWVVGLAAMAALAAVVLAWRGMRAEPRGNRRRVLVLLRGVAAALAVLLVMEPGIELLATTKLRGRVAVLVDRSRSMLLPAAPGGSSRTDAVASVLGDAADRAALESRFQVDYFAFAEGASPADPAALNARIDPQAPGLDRTQVLPSLEEAVRAAAGRPLAGVVLMSDGADNGVLGDALAEEESPEMAEARARLKALGTPVHALDAAGGQLKDLAIAAIKVDDFAFVRNTVEVEVELAQRGYGPLAVPVVLEREGQVVTTRDVTVSEGRAATVKLPFVPDTTGEFAFTVRVPVQGDESVAENNARSFVLKVIRDRIRVLHVAGRPSWDERFLRMLLKRDPNVDLISFFILRTPSDLTLASNDELSLIPFPTDEIFRQQLKSFDLVVFHNFTYRPYRMAQYLPGIAEYVKDGGAFLMLGGENSFSEGAYATSPIEEILPVQLENSPTPPGEEAFAPRLTAQGRRHPATELAPGEVANEAAWGALAQLQGINRTTLKAGAQALLVHPELVDANGQPSPVVAVWEVGRGRSMVVTTDSTWSWAFVGAAAGRAQRAYEDFYQHAFRWLVRDPDLTQVRVQAEKDRYAPSEPVAFIVKARLRDYGPAAGARVALELASAHDGSKRSVLEGIVGEEGALRIEAGTLPPGPWRAKVLVTAGSEELGQAEDAIVVEESGPELARPTPRPDVLKLVADATGGEYRPVAGAKLSELPLRDPERVEIGQRRSQPMWDRASVLAALCLVLGMEWLLRRRWGFF